MPATLKHEKHSRRSSTRAALACGCLISTAALQSASAQAQGRCFLYEPEVVVLHGMVLRFQAYGEPGYGEDPAHDTVERYEALKLVAPICVLEQGLVFTLQCQAPCFTK